MKRHTLCVRHTAQYNELQVGSLIKRDVKLRGRRRRRRRHRHGNSSLTQLEREKKFMLLRERQEEAEGGVRDGARGG